MAGDIGIRERAIVVPESNAASRSAGAALGPTRGRPMHIYGPRVVIAEVQGPSEQEVRALPGVEMGEKSSAIPAPARDNLAPTEMLGLKAFDLRQTDKYAKAKAERPLAGESWDNPNALPPNGPHDSEGHHHNGSPGLNGEHDHNGALADAGAPTSARLTGRVAVGLIIVEGPDANLKFSAAERTKVVAEVQNGLGWLGSYSTPAGVSWVYDIHVISLNTAPGADDLSFGEKEALWRDPAMASLGYGSGMAGVRKYVEDLRKEKKTDWAYCAFFTKYPVGWFAYASLGGPRLVMDYNNDGWGPDNIDRVFAHETGHIFNAPDEYSSSGCNCGGSWGYYGVPNSNCGSCASGGGVPCIMKSNDWTMCPYTPYHLGFPQQPRYTGVYEHGSGSYGLWVNASWQNFRNKWQQWAGQGLRLTDMRINRVGNQNRYSGVWRAGSGGYGLWVNASWSSFRNKWKEWSGQGLRLVDIEITRVNGNNRYSGVFKAGSGGYGLWVNASWTSFRNKWQEWSKQGLRLVDIEIVRVNGKNRYSGVFQAGSGGYGLWVNANWTSFRNKWQEWSGQGLRLVDIKINRVNNQNRYTGVYKAGTGGYGLWVNANWASFKEKWEEWSGGSLRLIDLEILGSGDAGAPTPAESAEASEGEGFGGLFSAEQLSEGEEVGFGDLFVEGAAADAASDDGGEGFGELFVDEDAPGEGVGLGEVVFGESPASSDDTGFGEMVGGNDAPVAASAGGDGFGEVFIRADGSTADSDDGDGFGDIVL